MRNLSKTSGHGIVEIFEEEAAVGGPVSLERTPGTKNVIS